MATGPTLQPIFGMGKIPYPSKCYRINKPFSPFPDLPNKSGVYVFADLSRNDTMGTTVPKVLYVGKAISFKNRVTERHEEWDKAKGLNITHICLLDEANENNRITIERDIYDKHNPPLNNKRP